MPYLDLRNHEDVTHLLQLYAASHPTYREKNEQMRLLAQAPEDYCALSGDYFVSIPVLLEVVAWARTKQFITRKHADDMTRRVRLFHTPPEEVVTVTRHGPEPQAPRTVQASALYTWLYGGSIMEGEEDYTILLRSAITLVEGERQEHQGGLLGYRAALLLAWLRAQQV